MKISTKGRYALRLMLDLALHDSGEYLSLKSISERQQISEKYLEQLISGLAKNNLVKSVRGKQGGYKLIDSPASYTVGQILRVIEGDLAPVACLGCGAVQCPRSAGCATLEVWKRLQHAVNGVLDGMTLEDLVQIYKQKNSIDTIFSEVE